MAVVVVDTVGIVFGVGLPTGTVGTVFGVGLVDTAVVNLLNKSTRPPDAGFVVATVGIVFGVGFVAGAVENLLNKSTSPPEPGFTSAGLVEAGVGTVFGVGFPGAAVVVNLLRRSLRPPPGIGLRVVVVGWVVTIVVGNVVALVFLNKKRFSLICSEESSSQLICEVRRSRAEITNKNFIFKFC